MKRIRLLILLGLVALALPFGLLSGVAKAHGGGGGGSTQMTINQYAQYNAAGAILYVGLNVRCPGGVNGEVNVQVDQSPPETPEPVGAGSGPQAVVCNGQTHSVAVTVGGFGFDAGKAKAQATLVVPTVPVTTATASRSIIITVEEP